MNPLEIDEIIHYIYRNNNDIRLYELLSVINKQFLRIYKNLRHGDILINKLLWKIWDSDIDKTRLRYKHIIYTLKLNYTNKRDYLNEYLKNININHNVLLKTIHDFIFGINDILLITGNNGKSILRELISELISRYPIHYSLSFSVYELEDVVMNNLDERLVFCIDNNDNQDVDTHLLYINKIGTSSNNKFIIVESNMNTKNNKDLLHINMNLFQKDKYIACKYSYIKNELFSALIDL